MSSPPPIDPVAVRPRLHPAWLILGIVLVAINLRPAIAGFGPLLAQIQREFGASSGTMSLMTAIPVLCFGLLGPLAPRLARRFGDEPVILACVALIAAGGWLRAGASLGTILAGTVTLGAGIAALNVLLPGFVKRRFPAHPGLMMGVFTMTLVGGAALGAGLAVPLRDAAGGDWRASIGAWSLLALMGLLTWLPVLFDRRPAAARGPHRREALWRDAVAWRLTVFMGLQSLLFFAWLTWLPRLFLDHGLDVATSGWMLAVANLVQIPVALGVPVLAGRMADQRPLALAVGAVTVVSLLGLLVAPMAAPLAWVMLLGVSGGATISLALSLIVLRARDDHQVASLSGMAQGLGYLMAASGPFVFGWLYDRTHRWEASLGLLVACALFMSVAAYGASRPGCAGQPPAADGT
ncbi:MAG: CynX/NimT family MFS transporter [Candidatus Sericytochromatia bacterium]